MANLLRLALWDANGLIQHVEELKSFMSLHNIDVMLITETHFTEKSYLILLNYTVYHINHPDGTARGRTAIIIQNSIQHHQLKGYCFDFLQATTVSVEESVGSLVISAVYLPPKHIVKQERLGIFYNTLGKRFIAGGDYNAKQTMQHLHQRQLSTGEPTYWPSDRYKLPDLLDFCVTRGIPPNSAAATSCPDLSSDHSPVVVVLTTHALPPDTPPSLSNRRTNWDLFRLLISERLPFNTPFKTTEDFEEAVKLFNDTIKWAGWTATPNSTAPLPHS
jgi:exonuclease III